MSFSSPMLLLDVHRRPGAPAMLLADAPGGASRWAAEHRDALRALVTRHGAIMVRGLGLREPGETAAVFRTLAADLMAEREAFAPRQSTPRACTARRSGPPTSRCACTTSSATPWSSPAR